MLYFAIIMMVLNSYTPTKTGWVGRLDNDTGVGVDTQNEWTAVDGFSDVLFLPIDDGYSAADTGLIIQRQGRYEMYIYGNFKKLSGSNAVNYQFCLTLNGTCIGQPQLVTLPNATNYVVSLAIVDLVLVLPGATYGLSVRNTTNDNDIVMKYAYLRARKE